MAGIIKSGRHQETTHGAQVASFNFEDMAHKADAYIETIRQQAAQILARAQQQAIQIEKEALERGRQAAKQEVEQLASAQLDQRLQTLVPALDEMIVGISDSRLAWLKHWEQSTLKLAAGIASRVIRRELSQTPEISLDWLREALELVTAEGHVTVRLHPRDLELLGDQVQILAARLSRLGAAQVVGDATIEPGGCRVETEFGSVDQQISAQLARIQEELTE